MWATLHNRPKVFCMERYRIFSHNCYGFVGILLGMLYSYYVLSSFLYTQHPHTLTVLGVPVRISIREYQLKILHANRMERCIGCHSCSLACARLVHSMLSWNAAGIRISSAGGLSTGFEARVCVACQPAPCAGVCPTGSLSQRKGGGVKVDKALCIQCGKCADACPVDAIYLDPADSRPYLCIHCGRCVPFCPHGCLELARAPHMQNTESEAGGNA